jgi:hypothetical protein
MLYSPDGRYLFIVSNPSGYLPLISTVDTQTFQLVGTAPAYEGTGNTLDGGMEIPMAAEDTGLIFGAAGYGLAIDDAAFFHTFPATAQFPAASGPNPAEGNSGASTPVSFPDLILSGSPIVWFGANQASSVSYSNLALQSTAPPSTVSGPVNVRIFDPEGDTQVMPEAFSYGPAAISYGSLAAGPQGGATVDLFGHGFSADQQGAAINVQIGGQAAPATKAGSSFSYELALQHLQVTAPSGSSGAQDITISAPTGTTTVARGFHILETVEDYSTTDTLLDVLYDSSRQQLDLSAGNHVDVFSLTTHSFLLSLKPPSLGGSLQLGGLALTPDSSKLLVANLTDRSVAIINPDAPSTAVAVQVAPSDPFGLPVPYQIATTSLNTAFVNDSLGYIYVLNLATQQFSLDSDPGLFYSVASDGTSNSLCSSREGATACIVTPFTDGGPILSWTASTNTWNSHILGNLKLDGSVSGDGNVCSSVGLGLPAYPFDVSFVDPQDNVVGLAGLPDFLLETYSYPQSNYVYGQRLNDSGSLLYIPFLQGVDIFDVQHGNLRERILLTETMSNGASSADLTTRPVHNMAIDETGQHIYLITNKGLTILQLDSVPLSVGSVTPSSGAAGAQVKVRGSGFVTGTTATANGTDAAVSFVDADTLQVVLPTLPAGAVQLTLTNPDGQTYILDGAFAVN